MSAVGRVSLRHNTAPEGMLCPPQHMHAGLFEPLFKRGFLDARFTVLRDPTARLVSEYRYRRGQVERKGKREMPDFQHWAERAFRLYAENPYFLDNHIRPQAEFVSDGMKLFRLENGLEPVTRWLEQLCGVEGPVVAHKLQGGGEPVTVSPYMRGKIEAFYTADFKLLNTLKD